MRDKDELDVEVNSSVDTKEKKTSTRKEVYKKSSKLSWVILVVLIMGFIAFLVANTDTFSKYFPQMNSSIVSNSGCSTTRGSTGSLQYGASAYSSNCRILTKEQQDEKRWQDILEASPVVIAAAGVVTAGSLIILTWQVSRLVTVLSKKR